MDNLPKKKLLKFKSKIIESKYINHNTKNILFSVPDDFDFYPGQFISLILFINGEEYRRPYSIASKPQKNKLELCIKILPNGKTTPTIADLKEGDEINVLGPMGTFYVNEKSLNKNIIFISTGTGIAPFRSIINNLLENNFGKNITLLTGYRYKEDILYEEEFKKFDEDYSIFSYFRILSRYGEENEKGYVQKLIDENFDLSADYYICGLKEMVNSVREHLESKGIKKENIFFEKYD